MNIVIVSLISFIFITINSYTVDWGITIIGDSRAQGLQTSSTYSYNNIFSLNSNGKLKPIIDDDIQEKAESGSTLSAHVPGKVVWKSRDANYYEDNKYITFIALGTNDVRRFFLSGVLSAEAIRDECKNNMESLLRKILDNTYSNVIISDIAPTYWRFDGFMDPYLNKKNYHINKINQLVNYAYIDLIDELRAEYGNRVGIVLIYDTFLDPIYYIGEGDWIHFNLVGNEVWAGLIAQKIIELGWDKQTATMFGDLLDQYINLTNTNIR